ncbi:hypothetical protein F5Y08DRAFT_354925 [Xylaria arbuscula]|nr:hypothetical protein F5Y08DRAFT_354925 [Xylaria arbuscula]
MAGPGGGPPRRSHTKSRHGCANCKRRHIRCDENFPQCRNCTKHKVRCPYNDRPDLANERAVTPDQPDLMWTPEIQVAIAEWQATGRFPFPSFRSDTPDPQFYTVAELRLIYYLASIYEDMEAIGANNFTLWTHVIPTMIAIGTKQRYVMNALLAFSADKIAFETGCPLVGNIAYEHRGNAINGLREAISNFSSENSNAVLAASLVLSWQGTDWKGWTHIMQGTASIINSIEQEDFINESSIFAFAYPFLQTDRKPHQPADVEAVFKRTIQHLTKVEAYVKQNKGDTGLVQQLMSYVRGARKVTQIGAPESQFDRLRTLRNWLFWLPIDCLRQNTTSPSALVVIAHYYAAAITIDRLFRDIGPAFYGTQAIGPIAAIARHLESIHAMGSLDEDMQTPRALMQFPLETMQDFRLQLGFNEELPTQFFQQVDSPDRYTFGHATPPPTTYIYGVNNPDFCWSQEELPSMLAPEPECGHGVTPLITSSPYHNAQYLNIPSPSYGGYSPASSTFGEGSIVYSDNEDFNSFDPTMSPGGPSGFGVRFVSLFQFG